MREQVSPGGSGNYPGVWPKPSERFDMVERTCEFPECGKPRRAARWCPGHVWQSKNLAEMRPLRARRHRSGRHLPEGDLWLCITCQSWVPRSEYRISRGYVASECLPCARARSAVSAKANTARKREWVRAYKLSHGCADCGYNARYEALDFDHLPGTVKSFNIGPSVGSHSMEDIMAEALKCEIVCANCHRIRTADRIRAHGVTAGTD